MGIVSKAVVGAGSTESPPEVFSAQNSSVRWSGDPAGIEKLRTNPPTSG
jgi:hypothetical protein